MATAMPVVEVRKREFVIPLFRVGVPEYKDGTLREVWETLKDWQHVMVVPFGIKS